MSIGWHACHVDRSKRRPSRVTMTQIQHQRFGSKIKMTRDGPAEYRRSAPDAPTRWPLLAPTPPPTLGTRTRSEPARAREHGVRVH